MPIAMGLIPGSTCRSWASDRVNQHHRKRRPGGGTRSATGVARRSTMGNRGDRAEWRVVIRLKEMSLVITGATDLKRCELPAVWLSETMAQDRGKLILDVVTDTGHIRVTGADLRLIRNSDLAVLIPPIDT